MGTMTLLMAMLMNLAVATPEADKDVVDPKALQDTYNVSDVMLTTKTWSGYLEVDANKSLHYMFIESKSENKTTDPVLIWFNGGPGCSSLLGMFQENGPLTVDSDGDKKFENNELSWNKRANVLYLEQPANVGFSIGIGNKTLNQSDYTQSVDTLAALNLWYVRFPEYVNNSLFVSGESYGGIYVPYLTWQVYEQNLRRKVLNDIEGNGTLPMINIKGFMVGNGVTNWKFDTNPSLPQTLGGFDMITNQILEEFQQNDCSVDFQGEPSGDDPDECLKLFNKMEKSIPYVLNPYDLYRKIPDEEQQPENNMTTEDLLKRPGLCLAKTHPWLKWRRDAYKIYQKTANLAGWLNQEDTKLALHVSSSDTQHNITWADCNSLNWQFLPEASQWIYTVLKTSGYIRMMHYSGDTDGVLPTYGTKQWIEDLGWEKTSKYEMWKTNDQVSGFLQKYQGLDFLTVKGVGHMAPQWAREPMQQIITSWIHQENQFAPETPSQQ